MRLWSLHPKYLDQKGLVALWREALLAQSVLSGQTTGYRNHPQLVRFKRSPVPCSQIAHYLTAVYEESVRRGYHFNKRKIVKTSKKPRLIPVTCGQLEYEWNHLKTKLKKRNPVIFSSLNTMTHPVPHPLFRKIPGKTAVWETGAARTVLKIN